MSYQSIIDEIDEVVHESYPRRVLNRTNWLYRQDALRPRDIDEMTVLWEMVVMLKSYVLHLLVLGSSIRSVIA